MTVDFTDDTHVGLYDTVSDKPLAIGLFGSREEADDFMVWLAERGEQGGPPAPDLRSLNERALEELRGEWEDERIDPETEGLRDGD